MLMPNWKDHDLETCPIINYFVDRNHTEQVLKKIEKKNFKKCFCCRESKDCKIFSKYLKVFKQNGFWTFNKHIKVRNVYDLMWCKKIPI